MTRAESYIQGVEDVCDILISLGQRDLTYALVCSIALEKTKQMMLRKRDEVMAACVVDLREYTERQT